MSNKPKAMFILGGPGSGKDYVITNILPTYGLTEVQMDQILNGGAKALIESKANLLVNGNADLDKIQLVKSILEGYDFSHTIVSVTNKISRERNLGREKPLNEAARIRKWLDAENISLPNSFVFKNSLTLAEASTTELDEFKDQIEAYLKFLEEALNYGGSTATPKSGPKVVINPTLTVKKLRKRGVKGMPPNAYDSRVGGVDLTGSGSSVTNSSFAGGLVSHHIPSGNMIKEISTEKLRGYLAKSRDNMQTLRANSMELAPKADDYFGDDKDEAEYHRKSNNRQAGIDTARRLIARNKQKVADSFPPKEKGWKEHRAAVASARHAKLSAPKKPVNEVSVKKLKKYLKQADRYINTNPADQPYTTFNSDFIEKSDKRQDHMATARHKIEKYKAKNPSILTKAKNLIKGKE